MRRSLLNKRILPKPLRQALVLITLLLLPSAAWGQGTFSTGNFQVTGDQSPYTYKWLIGTDNSDFWECDIENADVYCAGQDEKINQTKGSFNGSLTFNNPDNEMATSVSFNLNESRNRSITSITINLESFDNGVSISACGESFTPLSTENGNTLSFSLPYLWSDDISITVSLPRSSSVKISSISIETEKYLGVTVAGIPVTSGVNENDVLGDGTVSFTAASGTNPAILTLNGATLGTIDESHPENNNLVSIESGLDALTIKLQGENKLYGTITGSLENATLAFTGGGSLEISGESDSPISAFTSVNFGDFNLASQSAPGIHWESYEQSQGGSLRGFESEARDVTITKDTYYPIWIYDSSLASNAYASHTQLKSDKLSVAVGNGTVSFDGNHTITINRASINSGSNKMIVVGPDMPELTVHLVGASTGTNDATILGLWNTTQLTFTTDESNAGSLTAPVIASWYEGSGQISCENGLVYNAETNPQTISTTGVRIKIDGEPIELDNTGYITGTDNKAHFDKSTNTLTLTNATIGSATSGSNIQVYVDDLIVKIDGDNKIWGCIKYEGMNQSTSSIKIEKADEATNCSLEIDYSGSVISDFSNLDFGDLYTSSSGPMKYDKPDPAEAFICLFNSFTNEIISNVVFTTDTTYPLWIAGIQATAGELTGEVFQSGDNTFNTITNVSFTPGSTNILSFNGEVNEEGVVIKKGEVITRGSVAKLPAIISNLDNLTIQLTGENNISLDNLSLNPSPIKSLNSEASITFTTSSADEASLSCTMGSAAFTDGFKTVNYEGGLGCLMNGDWKKIQKMSLSSPAISTSEYEGVTRIEFNNYSIYYDGVQYFYKIDYADSSIEDPEEVELPVNSEYHIEPATPLLLSSLTSPCTITAYAKFNTTTSTANKAKLFGFADKTITLNSTTLNSELTADMLDIQPAIEEGDGVSLTITNSFNPVVIQRNESTGKATIVGIGECNLDVSLAVLSSSSLTVLNTREGDVVRLSTKVTVLPDKPSIEKDTEHDYLETDKITITRTSVDGEDANDLKIFYTWDKDIVVETYQQYTEGDLVSIYDPNEKIPAQTGALRAWVGYHAGDNCFYNSEVVSEEFTVYKIAEMEWESESQTYGTYYNPDKDMAVPSGSTAYIVTGISEDGTKVTISPVSYIKAGVAVLIERDKTTEVSKTTDFSASKMEYSNPDTPAKPSSTDNWYVIYNNKFVKVTEGTQVKGGKCYLNLSSSVANTRGFYNIGDGEGTTAIREVIYEGVNSEKLADGAWHDLQGRKFTTKPTKPGLYILNGKKIVIK